MILAPCFGNVKLQSKKFFAVLASSSSAMADGRLRPETTTSLELKIASNVYFHRDAKIMQSLLSYDEKDLSQKFFILCISI